MLSDTHPQNSSDDDGDLSATNAAATNDNGAAQQQQQTQGGDADLAAQWAAYYRTNPVEAVAAGYQPPPELKAEVEGAAQRAQ